MCSNNPTQLSCVWVCLDKWWRNALVEVNSDHFFPRLCLHQSWANLSKSSPTSHQCVRLWPLPILPIHRPFNQGQSGSHLNCLVCHTSGMGHTRPYHTRPYGLDKHEPPDLGSRRIIQSSSPTHNGSGNLTINNIFKGQSFVMSRIWRMYVLWIFFGGLG